MVGHTFIHSTQEVEVKKSLVHRMSSSTAKALQRNSVWWWWSGKQDNKCLIKIAVRINCVFHKWEFKNVHDRHIVCSILPLSLQSKVVTKLIQEGLEKEEKPKSPKGPALLCCPWTALDSRCAFLPEEQMELPEPWFEKHDLRTQRRSAFASSMTVGCLGSCLIGSETQGECPAHLVHSLRLTQPSLLWHFCSTELQILASL